jgi:hypothetical protein
LAIGELILKFGVPAALDIAAVWNSDLAEDPTMDDIERLRNMVPEPSTFFEEGE